MLRRARHQKGSLQRVKRKSGQNVWIFRWYEIQPDGDNAAQVALSWLTHRPDITAPIASATSVAQLKELIGGIELKLDEEALATLDSASAWKES